MPLVSQEVRFENHVVRIWHTFYLSYGAYDSFILESIFLAYDFRFLLKCHVVLQSHLCLLTSFLEVKIRGPSSKLALTLLQIKLY